GVRVIGGKLLQVSAVHIEVRDIDAADFHRFDLGHLVDFLSCRRREEAFPTLDVFLSRAALARTEKEDDQFSLVFVGPGWREPELLETRVAGWLFLPPVRWSTRLKSVNRNDDSLSVAGHSGAERRG